MQTVLLAEFAAAIRHDDIPADVRIRARDCIQDTIGVAVFGSELPWSRIVVDYVRRNAAATGLCQILGIADLWTSAPFAALANGAFTHAFEMDSIRKPGAGVHPGGLVAPGLAVAEDLGAGGHDLVTAFVAGMEVTTRIGIATHHSPEAKGFHAPGLTGVFGAAVVAGRLLGLDAKRMHHALGVAGSLCCGLLEFARSGGMVKRLHLGRAAEGGVLAAQLAADGFEGPARVLEGDYGFLEAFADGAEPERLIEGLGKTWETRTICFKRCACHITAHGPIEGLEALRTKHGFTAEDVSEIVIGASDKACANHDIPAPMDIGAAQYSIPFSVALSLLRDPVDPRAFLEDALTDSAILDLAKRIRLEPYTETRKPGRAWAVHLAVRLRDGRVLTEAVENFRGCPEAPFREGELDAKFRIATRSLGAERSEALLAQLKSLDALPSLRELGTASPL